MKNLILAGCLATLCSGALADTPVTTAPAASSAAAPVVSKQLHDDIVSLLQVTLGPHLGEVTKIMSTMYVSTMQAKYRNISPAVADEIRDDIGKIVTDPEHVKALDESLVPIYSQLYTDDEIRQILAFSKTPAGAKYFAGTPNQEQINAALQPWAMGTLAPAILMDTAKILKEHNITINTDGTSNDSGNPAH